VGPPTPRPPPPPPPPGRPFPASAEGLGLVEGFIRTLGEQVVLRPRAGTESDYNVDLRDEVPVLETRRATNPGWLRHDSAF